MSKQMVLKPRISEKSYGLSEKTRTYIFDVPTSANKLTVKEAITAQFDVTVEKVNIQLFKGKSMRFIRKGGKIDNGSRKNVKRAYITVKEGDVIPVFAAVEDDKPAEKDKKTAKKETK